jgi:hypothetical protein
MLFENDYPKGERHAVLGQVDGILLGIVLDIHPSVYC